jgi:hypothetical protein
MGVWDRRARSAGRRRWLGAAVAAAAVSLSACGSVTVTATGTAAHTGSASQVPSAIGAASQVRSAGRGTLCAAAGAVDRLTVSRVNSIPGNHQQFSFPATVAVAGAAQARAVARALCALPARPRGPIFCPIDLGVTYRLGFAVSGPSLPPVTIGAGGCEEASGAGMARWIGSTPAFWTVLGKAMGLTNPGHSAFVGTMPS